MARKPKQPKTQTIIHFTPRPEPAFVCGARYVLLDGAQVTVRIIEWLRDKWIYYLTKHSYSSTLRILSVVSEAELKALDAHLIVLEAA